MTTREALPKTNEDRKLQNGPPDRELSVRADGIAEPNSDFNRKMGNIWLELLKKAAWYAAVMGLLAGLAAALFFRS